MKVNVGVTMCIVIALMTMVAPLPLLTAQKHGSVGLQLGKITIHAPDPMAFPLNKDRVWYSNDTQTCQVWVQDDGSIRGNATEVYVHSKLMEYFEISKDAKRPHIKKRFQIEKNGWPMNASQQERRELFRPNCRRAVNRDLPADVKAKFYNFLGVK